VNGGPPSGWTRKLPRRVWSIGLYTGPSPLDLSPTPEIANPVFTAHDVSDVKAVFVADPFMISDGEGWTMFFEVLNAAELKGQIGAATSMDGRRWTYRGIVLDEPFHLSYPYVFRWAGDIFLIPEAWEAEGIGLYRAVHFPDRWERVAVLVRGSFADASILRHEGRWWLFACATPFGHDTLRLFIADELTGPWREHPASPLVEGDCRKARPGGRVTVWDGRLLRFTQDCHPAYGTAVRAFEILELTPGSYREREACSRPVLSPGGESWNELGMHHLDPHSVGPRGWIACVDGCRWRMPP
jgi:hypothetical protein